MGKGDIEGAYLSSNLHGGIHSHHGPRFSLNDVLRLQPQRQQAITVSVIYSVLNTFEIASCIGDGYRSANMGTWNLWYVLTGRSPLWWVWCTARIASLWVRESGRGSRWL